MTDRFVDRPLWLARVVLCVLLVVTVGCTAISRAQLPATSQATGEVPPAPTLTGAPAPTDTATPQPTRSPTRTPTRTPRPTATPPATDTPRLAAPPATSSDEPETPSTPWPPAETSTPAATTLPPPPVANHPYDRPLVIANYFPWYDEGTWSRGCTSAGDTPRDGVYNSDDDGVIQRHIGQAQAAGLDGFAVHFFAPGDRTDANFQRVLAYSGGGFRSTVTFLTHILPGATLGAVRDSLAYLLAMHSGNGAFLQYGGKPVILFADMPRIPDDAGGRTGDDAVALARWRAVRDAVDPGHQTLWIAEGLNPIYLDVFDGLYVYKIDHACCPGAYHSAARWAGWVRSAEQASGQPKYWIGTVMPGWNDVNSANPGCEDLRVSSEPFARDRAGGAYYAATWNAVLPTQPDFVVVHSFNEWVEGSYIEPSAFYGDQYLGLTAQWAALFHSSR